jgi:predicted Zn-dependent protease
MSVSAAQAPGLISIFPEVVELGGGCATTGKISLPTHALIDIENVCQPGKWRTGFEAPTTCSGRSFPVLGVRFRGRQDLVLAESVSLAIQQFHIRLFGALEDAHGDRQEIVGIERVEWCADNPSTPSTPQLPPGSCLEPRQFAVAFDYGTPLNNKILTNGFSFYIRVSGRPPTDFDFENVADEVLASFGRALSIWTAALQNNDALLTPATRAFIRSRKSTSSSYVLLTPPQVMRLRCPHAAIFIVELNFGGDETFPVRSLVFTLAKARLEGRTIALNMRDVTCFRTMPESNAGQLALRDERCVNLLPILTHELGHAFGLDHIPNTDGPALMNPVLSDRATVPTRLDVSALVAALERSVTGARPGELEFREAAGLQAPSDWAIERK